MKDVKKCFTQAMPSIISEGKVLGIPSVDLQITQRKKFIWTGLKLSDVLSAYQLSTIAKQIPRNCLLYNFAYATHSECLAFAVAWSQLFDGLCFMAVLAHCLSDHVVGLYEEKSVITGGFRTCCLTT